MTDGTSGMDYYVYALLREDEVTPFYVGKGHRHRWGQHESEARAGATGAKADMARHVISVLGHVPRIKLAIGLSEQQAFDLETDYIIHFGRQNLREGPLLNVTDGGEGASGYRPTEEDRAKKSASQTTPEALARRRSEIEWRKENTDWLAKLSEGQKRAREDPEIAARLDGIMRAAIHSPEARAKANESLRRTMATPEYRAKLSASQRAYATSPEGRASMAARGANRWRQRHERNAELLLIAAVAV